MVSNANDSLRKALTSSLSILMILSTTFMAWKTLCILTDSPTPIVVVVSESMAPAFHRGDILMLSNRPKHVHVGDIPVVWFAGNPLPMVHRVIKTWYTEEGQQFLTKGDNNELDDVGLYPPGRLSVSRGEVLGFVRMYVPYVGWVAIAVQENLSITRLWSFLARLAG